MDKRIPFTDASLDTEKRIDWLLSQMNTDEKLHCLATVVPDIERLGIKGFSVGGEAAHGVEARNDQNEIGIPEETTSFPQPIGMSASWDTELIKKAGEITGIEARVIYHRHPDRGLSRWAPTVDLERDPRWGRTEEGYGEDPVLTGAMASAYIRGMQGEDPEHLRVAATLKHFYGNNTENGRGWKSSSIDPRNKYELYLEPFRRAIQDGHAEAMMTAYNRINGIPGMLNHEVRNIMKDQFGLKHAVCDGGAAEMIVKLHHYFGLDAETVAEGIKAGIDGFSDRPEFVEKAAKEAYELKLISEKEIDEALRNMFRTKIRLGIYDAEPVNPFDSVTEADINSAYNQKVCRELSEESVVLLKNSAFPGEDGAALPLSEDISPDSIAIIGPSADSWYQDWYGGRAHHRTTLKDGIENLLGKNAAFSDAQDRIILRYGSRGVAAGDDGRLYVSDKPDVFIMNDWGCGSYTFFCVRTGKYMSSRLGSTEEGQFRADPVAADRDEIFDWFTLEIFHIMPSAEGTVKISDRFNIPVVVTDDGYLQAAGNAGPSEFKIDIVENGIEKACLAAKGKKTVILALGCNPMINSKEEVDRTTIALPPVQQKLIDAILEVNRNVVMVLFSDYPYAVTQAEEKVPAILWSATGSQDMGSAAASCLFGRTAPAGRLNMTWYTGDDQLPDINDYDIIKGRRTYRYFDGKVLYPFGYGLTYTEFEYSGLKAEMADTETMKVSVRVKNAGQTMSDEVVQIYASAPASRVKKPRIQLIGFTRLKNIIPDETREAVMEIPVSELRFYDVVGRRLMVEEGTYAILAGASSADIRLDAEVRIPGEKTGFRDMKVLTPADLYDDYDNIYLTEGKFGYTAAAPSDSDIVSRLEYRDCLIPENAEKLRMYLKSGGCSIEIMINGKMSGRWEGDTRTWKGHDGLRLSETEKNKVPQESECEGEIFMDEMIPLSGISALAGQHADIEIKAAGDFRICWFMMG